MKNLGTQTIETERLILRRISGNDAENGFKNWTSDPNVTTYLRWKPHESVEYTREVFERWAGFYDDPAYYQWTVELKEIGQPIGTFTGFDVDENVEKVQIGYCIGSKWWRRGIATEALNALLDFFFNKVGVNRVEARHDTNNPNSGKVMKKCGMKYEGTYRQAYINNTGLVDVSMYSILAKEYFDKPLQ